MSYELVNKIRIDERNNSIKILHASNNVFPRRYYTSEYINDGETFREGLKGLFFSIMDGNLQLNKGTGEIYTIVNMCYDYKRSILGDVFGFDLEYKTNFDEQTNQILFEYLFQKYINKQDINHKKIRESLNNIKSKMPLEKDAYIKKLKDEGKIRVRGASLSFIYKGYDVFIDEKNEQTILALAENYENGTGILNNKNNDAIFLGLGTEQLWSFLRFDGFWDGKYTKQEIINKLVEYDGEKKRESITERYNNLYQLLEKTVKEKLSHLTMTKLPYVDFAM